jgi:hypothetical protein
VRKYLKASNYKVYNLRRARKSLKKSLQFKDYLKKKQRKYLSLSTSERRAHEFYHNRYRDYKKIVAPKDFSFLRNPELVSYFIRKVRKAFDQKSKVFIVLRDVQKVDYDALIVLLSILVRFKAKGIGFTGDFPINTFARDIIVSSGFFENLYRNFVEQEEYKIVRQNYFHTHAMKKVDSELGERLMENVLPKVWGEKRVYKGLQRTLIELMQNSHNHAEINNEGTRHWWLSVSLKTRDKRATFAFIDYGVGIFENLYHKEEGDKWYGWAEKLLRYFQFGDNAETLKLILDGHLHKTVTGQHYRGKGLPGIKEALDRNLISNLHIISNDVFANVPANEYRIIDNAFSGTFIYWEINSANIYHPWTESN